MKNVAILCLALVFFPTLAFSQQTDASANALASDSETDALFEKYLEESRNLNQEFTPLCNQLRKQVKITIDSENIRDYFLWDREYCQPLFERSKQIMRRLTGCDDYLFLGIGVTYAYCRPFGFIHKTSLVGYDPSATITQPGSNTQINPTERYYTNDPFNLSSFEIDTSETYGYILKYDANNNLLVERSQFGNHAFAVYNGSVYDACAGPIKGVELLDYYSNTIDFVANQQWNQFHQLNGYLAESSNSMPQYNSFVVSIS